MTKYSKPARIKRFLNFVDDSSSPAVRSRLATSTKAARSPVAQPATSNSPDLDSIPMTPKTLSKTITERFSECIYASNTVDLDKLRKLSWSGIPAELRPICWKLLIVPKIAEIYFSFS